MIRIIRVIFIEMEEWRTVAFDKIGETEEVSSNAYKSMRQILFTFTPEQFLKVVVTLTAS